ncbi:sulfurase [Thalassobius sp. Cn5-15]|jgi:hypothetical protein|uniref:MOSC domain-containing protein n=1 Tax=Thalassobius sp. Cn5-15 TaxID=2917763 RepID=UPI001EF2C372|nr:sulfurase [Thalassobius sp. Cn5-15]MCG7493207.1 sulfurase [Thalassobius sp. Cn5-15]
MPALKQTDFHGTIEWLGVVEDRAQSLASSPREALTLDWGGVAADSHAGVTRPSCGRVAGMHARGTTIRNTRQICLMAAEDLEAIAIELGIGDIDPAWLGTTVLLRGIPDFSRLPPSSRLQAPSGASLVVDMENRPCNLPIPVIEAATKSPARGLRAAAWAKRGVTAWVEREGEIALGDSLQLSIPDQPEWAHYDEVRTRR